MEGPADILDKLPSDALEHPEDYPEIEKSLAPGESLASKGKEPSG